MKITFICLANSQKNSGRCIAGIKVLKKSTNYTIVKNNSSPQWVRPVTTLDIGQVDYQLVKDVKLLDIIEVDVAEAVPVEYQSENVLFEKDSIKKVGYIDLSNKNLKLLTYDFGNFIFGNTNNSLNKSEINNFHYSLIFIKVDNLRLYEKLNYYNKNQLRAIFSYRGHSYDLPITDKFFYGRYLLNNSILDNQTDFYFTVSLSVELNSTFYKLIAGVFTIPG